MSAPKPKARKELMAADHGLPSWSGSRPSSSRAKVSRATSGLAIMRSATARASCLVNPLRW